MDRDRRGAPGAGPSLAALGVYFLRLGATGFGGPVALANAMRRDLVETRSWLSEEEFDAGLAIAAACPGPLAYQLGVYCGYVRLGIAGGLTAAGAFAAAPFLVVTAAAAAYRIFADGWQLRAAFYGIAPVIVALILRGGWNLGVKTLRRERGAWMLAATACAVTIALGTELTPLFLAGGALGAVIFAQPRGPDPKKMTAGPARPAARASVLALLPPAALGASGTTWALFAFFFKTGMLVFGSGLVIVPFLQTYVVDQYHWLSKREFLDSVAIGMVSPGPVVITATFVGYLLGGLGGAAAATLGIFSPAVLFTLLGTPFLLRHRGNARLAGFVRGVTVTVVGVLAGTTWLVARGAIGDPLTSTIAVLSVAVLFRWKRCPEPLLVLAGGAIGLFAHPVLGVD